MFCLERVILDVPRISSAREFYSAALAPNPTVYDHSIDLDAHGITFDENATAKAGFRGYIISYILAQPTEVRAVLESAVANGATMSLPAKKGFFGGFSGVFQAPDGAIWKLAAPTKKDTGPATDPPVPTEVGVILGVAKPRTSKAFYTALGMTVDRDYGDKFVDFELAPGATRLGVMPTSSLAKDVGADSNSTGSTGVALGHRAASRSEVDRLLTAADAAGGKAGEPADTGEGYHAEFTDPDGHLWHLTAD